MFTTDLQKGKELLVLMIDLQKWRELLVPATHLQKVIGFLKMVVTRLSRGRLSKSLLLSA